MQPGCRQAIIYGTSTYVNHPSLLGSQSNWYLRLLHVLSFLINIKFSQEMMPEVSGSHSSSISPTALYSVFQIRLCLKDTILCSLLHSQQQVRIRDLSPAHPFLFGLVIITNYIYLAGITNNINHTHKIVYQMMLVYKYFI